VTRTLRLFAVAVGLLAVVACGGDSDSDSSDSSASSSAPVKSEPAADPPVPNGVTEILATARIKFVPGELTATVGKVFKGRLVQRGGVPHNIEFKDFGVKPEDTLVSSDGDAKEFSFTPTKAGTFTFICTIHPAEMKGTLTVS